MSPTTYPFIKSGTADAVLAGIWRKICYDLDIDDARLDDLILGYTKKMTYNDPQKRAQDYGNWSSDLKQGQMTWTTFLRGPRCLNVKRMSMEFRLNHLRYNTIHTLAKEYPEPHEPVQDSETSETVTELSQFLMQIMHDLGVTVSKISELLNVFVRRQTRLGGAKPFLKGNVKKEFFHPRLSWASFIRALDFLTIPSFDLKITLEFYGRRRKVTNHRMSIVINTIEDLMAFMDESEFLIPNVTVSTTEDSNAVPVPEKGN